jgi:hypothetical protein
MWLWLSGRPAKPRFDPKDQGYGNVIWYTRRIELCCGKPYRMSLVRSIATFGLLFAAPAVFSGPGGPVSAQGQRVPGSPMEITSDTREYCLHLLDRVSDLVRLSATPVPSEVTTLSAEGERLCDHGQPKPGILRLRRALMIMEHDDGSAYR